MYVYVLVFISQELQIMTKIDRNQQQKMVYEFICGIKLQTNKPGAERINSVLLNLISDETENFFRTV